LVSWVDLASPNQKRKKLEKRWKKKIKEMRTLRTPEKTMKNANPGGLSQMMFYFLQCKLDVLLFDFKCPLTLCLGLHVLPYQNVSDVGTQIADVIRGSWQL